MHNVQRRYALAFDTSAYTTSVAVVGDDGHIAYDGRIMLDVPKGQRGLRQSEAVFQHIVNLPRLLEGAQSVFHTHPISIIAASTKPRNVDDSYMPVFIPGFHMARSLAVIQRVPLLPLSHQEGHMWAAFLFQKEVPSNQEPFLAVHVSGGTTEALMGTMQADGRIALRIVGKTTDLTAGKFIDRIGVRLGFSFPAGPAVEQAASRVSGDDIAVRPAILEHNISFSGPLTALERAADNHTPNAVAHAAQRVLAAGLARWVANVVRASFPQLPRQAYFVGGVAANQAVRTQVKNALGGLGVHHVIFPSTTLCTDNALGTAFYAARHHT